MSDHVSIFEVGPRDGLQNIKAHVATADKVALITALGQAGLTRIEATSFVSPKWVPQLADAAEVMARIPRRAGLRYAVLAPNMRGYEAAIAAGADEVAVFASASEGFSQANLNCSIEDSLARFAPIIAAATKRGMPVRGYLSAIIACPYDGPTAPAVVTTLAGRLLDMGCYEVSLGDTIGAGTAASMDALLSDVRAELPASQLAGHFHDTKGAALGLVDVALQHGLRSFDASIAGLGGCPYAPGAPGNLATEALHAHLTAAGLTTDIEKAALDAAATLARRITGAG